MIIKRYVRAAYRDERAGCWKRGCDEAATHAAVTEYAYYGKPLRPVHRLVCRRHAELYAAEHGLELA